MYVHVSIQLIQKCDGIVHVQLILENPGQHYDALKKTLKLSSVMVSHPLVQAREPNKR